MATDLRTVTASGRVMELVHRRNEKANMRPYSDNEPGKRKVSNKLIEENSDRQLTTLHHRETLSIQLSISQHN